VRKDYVKSAADSFDDYHYDERQGRDEKRAPRASNKPHWETTPQREGGIIVDHAGTCADKSDGDTCFYCKCPISEHALQVVTKSGTREVLPVTRPRTDLPKIKTAVQP